MRNRHPTLGNGKVCYMEIPAIDINASAAFYKEVFGWQICLECSEYRLQAEYQLRARCLSVPFQGDALGGRP